MSIAYHQLPNGLKLWMRKTPHRDIVTVMGIAPIPGWDKHPAWERAAFVDLLDKGTLRHNKLEIALAIESVGGEISFEMLWGHLCWKVRAMKQDLPELYPWVHEMLYEASFPEQEVELWKKLSMNHTQESLSDPGDCADRAWSQKVYPVHHPEHEESVEAYLLGLQKCQASDLQARYQNQPWRAMQVVVVGDVDPQMHIDMLSSWTLQDSFHQETHAQSQEPDVAPCSIHLDLPDRPNLEVRMGHRVAISMNDQAYWPLVMGVDALGGTFSARLMRTVRDVEGLTYGVGSRLLVGPEPWKGAWWTSITLASEFLERGIQSTRTQIDRWWHEGVGVEELEDRKRGFLGRYRVMNTKTTQMAVRMIRDLIFGFPVDASDQVLAKIAQLEKDQVDQAIREFLKPDALVIVAAGTHPKPSTGEV